MLINVTFNNDKITATTETSEGKKVSARVHRDFNYTSPENANIAVEKLLAKTDNFEPLQDVEFIIHSTREGYIYISLTDTYTSTFITNGIKEVN